jgi:hypothetical protein
MINIVTHAIGFRTPRCDDTLQMLDDLRSIEALPRDRSSESFVALALQKDRLMKVLGGRR